MFLIELLVRVDLPSGIHDVLIGFDRIQAFGRQIQVCLVGCLDKDLGRAMVPEMKLRDALD